MRTARALISALLVMLASLVPSLAPDAAWAQGGTGPVVTVRDAGAEAFLRGIAHPLFRAADMDPALVRITLVQARPINAFGTTGNRMFVDTGLIRRSGRVAELAGVPAHGTGRSAGGAAQRRHPRRRRHAAERGGHGRRGGARRAGEALPPGPFQLRAQDLREAARRDNLTREQREQDDAMRRKQPR